MTLFLSSLMRAALVPIDLAVVLIFTFAYEFALNVLICDANDLCTFHVTVTNSGGVEGYSFIDQYTLLVAPGGHLVIALHFHFQGGSLSLGAIAMTEKVVRNRKERKDKTNGVIRNVTEQRGTRQAFEYRREQTALRIPTCD